MYFRDDVYSEPIGTVNATVVGVYSTHNKAFEAARSYFFQRLGLNDSGKSENGGFYFSATENHGDCGTWDEEPSGSLKLHIMCLGCYQI